MTTKISTGSKFLSLSDLVGIGRHRKCYVHPEDDNYCVKIAYNSNPKEDKREQAYYRHLQKRGISWEMMPRSHGFQETNFGVGSVFDLIRDSDGSVSKTLMFYLKSERTEKDNKELSQALFRLKEYLLSQNILTMTLKSKNIVYQKRENGSRCLVIVDNIGYSDLIPLCAYVPFFGRRKILRKWDKFMADYLDF